MTATAVLDIGKTNVKLYVVGADGAVLETYSTPNRTLEGPPYRHHDLARIEAWLIETLRGLADRREVEAIVPCGHGGAGVLVGQDGPALPMMDYEQTPPPAVDAAYRATVDDFRERGGSRVMLGAVHAARQLLWMEAIAPEAVAAAAAWLHTPQYWSWRLSGVMADEVTSAAAQSHLWCAPDRRRSAIVARRGWDRLMAPMRPAYASLGPVRPDLAARAGLDRATRVVSGIHDSSANFYRYQAAGLTDFIVVSTGTWIVALSDRAGVDFRRERPGVSCNAAVDGAPLPCMLVMGGREFAAVAGGARGPASRAALADIVARGALALPCFSDDDGLFAGRARRGRLEGAEAVDRFTLATLYVALLTAEILDAPPRAGSVVLDGAFVHEPLYGALVQALHPATRVFVNPDSAGQATGAALLAGHATRLRPAPLALEAADPAGLPDLARYRALWRDRIASLETSP